MIQDLVKVQDRVKDLLIKFPQTRDSDKWLWLAYNCKYNNLKGVFSLSAITVPFDSEAAYTNFKNWLLNPDTPMFESLSRARRKVQELYPHLSGDLRPQRMEDSENVKQWSLLE